MAIRTMQAAGVSELPRGTRVQVTGQVRSVEPVASPRGGAALLGYSIACSVFTGRRGLPEFDRTHQVVLWKDAVLEDPSGTLHLSLEDSVIRVPAGEELNLHDTAAMERALRGLGLSVAAPVQLQLLERSVRDGLTVTVTGTVDVVSDNKGAFRSSARPRVVLRGDRAAPMVLLPR